MENKLDDFQKQNMLRDSVSTYEPCFGFYVLVGRRPLTRGEGNQGPGQDLFYFMFWSQMLVREPSLCMWAHWRRIKSHGPAARTVLRVRKENTCSNRYDQEQTNENTRSE
jgi:hypothetical protein